MPISATDAQARLEQLRTSYNALEQQKSDLDVLKKELSKHYEDNKLSKTWSVTYQQTMLDVAKASDAAHKNRGLLTSSSSSTNLTQRIRDIEKQKALFENQIKDYSTLIPKIINCKTDLDRLTEDYGELYENANDLQEGLEEVLQEDCSNSGDSFSSGNSMLDSYATHRSVKSLAMAILEDVQKSGLGRRYLLRNIIRACHPHKIKPVTIAAMATAKSVTQVANKLFDDFTENELWEKPDKWDSQVDHLIHNGEIG